MTEKEKLEQLVKESEQMKARLAELSKEKGHENGNVKADAIQKEEIEKMVSDMESRMIARFESEKNEAKDNLSKEMFGSEPGETFGKFLKKVKTNDPSLSQYMKANLVEGSDSTGGYLVPTGMANTIIGELTNSTSIVPKTTPFPHGMADGYVKTLPKWLTNVTVYWPGEVTAITASNPTFDQKTSTLKVMGVVIPESAELRSDNIVGLDRLLAEKVGEAMAYEMERLILVGSTGSSDAFNGIAADSDIKEVDCSGASLTYNNLVNIWNNPNVLEKYRAGAEWYFNRTVLGIIMKMVDDNGRPFWNIQPINNQLAANVFGSPINISNAITNVLGDSSNTTKIIYGDYKNVYLGYKEGNTGISVDYNTQGAISTTNLWTLNMIGWRFLMRRSIVVGNPEAFSVGDEVPVA